MINSNTGPCVILAGAGTGKTYALVEKIKYLVQNKHYNPEEIVCLTFSNEAADSLQMRILSALEIEEPPIIKTIHSFCADLLRKNASKINMNESFRIWLPEDIIILFHTNFHISSNSSYKYARAIGTAKDFNIDYEKCREFVNNKLNSMPFQIEKELEQLQLKLHTLYLAKEKRSEKSALAEQVHNLNTLLQRKKFLDAWKAYEKLKAKKNAQDYGDLIKNAILLIKTNPDVIEKYKYLLIDEFQDTNKIQLDFIELLAGHKNITIVGDLNQSIYRFRGAYKDNFSYFKKVFHVENNSMSSLTKSYRSPNTVLTIAHQLIQKNYENKDECFFVENAHGKSGDKVSVIELKNAKEEARKIIEIIEHESSSRQLEDIAVIFRTHQQANLLKKILDEKNIPYISVSNQSLFRQPIVKKAIDYLNVLHKLKTKSKGGEHSWWNLAHSLNLNSEDSIIFGEFMRYNEDNNCISIAMLNELSSLDLSEDGKNKITALLDTIKDLIPSTTKSLTELLQDIYSRLGVSNETKEDQKSLILLQTFQAKAIEFTQNEENADIASFLDYIDVINRLGIEIPSPVLEEKGIRIMTAHATKGLEFPVVILSSLAQKKFPIEKISLDSLIPPQLSPELENFNSTDENLIIEYEKEHQLKEERRLCYVAFTRAKEKLYITYAREYNNKYHEPSQFLQEINYKENPNITFVQDMEEKPISEPKIETHTISSIKKEKNIVFSQSALNKFVECAKKYEYQYVYNMPEPEPVYWESMLLGQFVHVVAEYGVKENFRSLNQFILFAKEMNLKPEWTQVDIKEALKLITIFFERNKHKYNEHSKSEQHLYAKIDGIHFQGFADRIDFHSDGSIEIIDYKTGASYITPQQRNWQLGLYALASQKLGKVKRVTLELLKHERPLEFELDEQGNAIEINTRRMSFNLNDIREELVTTAKRIIECYQLGFPACPIEKNCAFCNEHVWKI